MAFSTVRIEGSIFTADILDKVASGEIKGQGPLDFGLKPGTKVKDEIASAWADGQAMWHVFKRQMERVREGAPGAVETRKFWMVPLLGMMGYDAQYTGKAEIVDNQTYDISHQAANLGGFPIHIMGYNDSLDKKRESGGPRLSPHALVQEYLNLTEHLYAVVTNGFTLRLLRDSTRLVKLSYIEFDLRSMMEDGHYAEFALMFRLLHASRMPVSTGAGPDSIIESYHQESLESGARIREGLSAAVEGAIKSMAGGFLNHPANTELRRQMDEGTLSAESLYQSLLRLIYRLLFLMVIEERWLIFAKDADKDKRDIYYDYYSVSRLRKRCENLRGEGEKHSDLWMALTHTFRLFEDGEKGKHLEIKPLSGQLFASGAIGILAQCSLENKALLGALESLSLFRQRNSGQKIRVNYGSLNVEEFGSVYEGLLEYAPEEIKQNGRRVFVFKKGTERSTSGSHYTPEELVQPLIRHSLDHLIEACHKPRPSNKSFDQTFTKVWPPAGPSETEKALLSIKVCDATCGSGHILLSAARRIGVELAKVRTGEDQPSPTAIREGIRDAVTHCIYGVDKNPLAVELCKVALWLEAHVPGEPLNFLDHRIKCGDAIVGLAHKEELEQGIPDEAFNRMPGDDPEVVRALGRRNRTQRNENLAKLIPHTLVKDPMDNIIIQFQKFAALPERSIEEIEYKEAEYKKLVSGRHWQQMKRLADLRVAQFFIPKTQDNVDILLIDSDYWQYLKGYENVSTVQVKAAEAEGEKRKFFHWFLEFPDVFIKGGFDCIMGNPPFLGGLRISPNFGYNYFNWIKYNFAPAGGTCDLAAYFFRRDYTLIKQYGFLGLISTNTIAQGDTREGGLDIIEKMKGSIIFVVRSLKWPGAAKLVISLISIFKGEWKKICHLDNDKSDYINSYFANESIIKPYNILSNKNKAFIGSNFSGSGFILTANEKDVLISKDIKNKDVIFPLLNGDDLNKEPIQSNTRYIINFFDWSEEIAKNYEEPYRIIKEKVFPERQKQKEKIGKEKWWQYMRARTDLYLKIKTKINCFAAARTSKYMSFSACPTNIIFTDATVIYDNDKFSNFSIIQSTLHNEWARKYSSTLETRLRYTPSDCFETFPFPQNLSKEMEQDLEKIGECYHEHRRQLMMKMELGLTKTYNLFHKKDLSLQDIIKESKKDTPTVETAFQDLLKLRELHKQMDMAVLTAYGWTDIHPAHDFYEVDYLPENDRIRFTISPDSRKEILKRLLLLNHQVHKQELEQTPPPKTKTAQAPKDPLQKTLF